MRPLAKLLLLIYLYVVVELSIGKVYFSACRAPVLDRSEKSNNPSVLIHNWLTTDLTDICSTYAHVTIFTLKQNIVDCKVDNARFSTIAD